jgi:hypothetical protein
MRVKLSTLELHRTYPTLNRNNGKGKNYVKYVRRRQFAATRN